MFRNRTDVFTCLILFLLCLFVFSSGLSIHGLEYRDDEIFYFKSTQEMIQTGNIWSPTYFGEDRFQKPILFYWLVLASYKLFGVNWFGARFAAVFFGSLTVCLTWMIGRALFNRRMATLSSIILMTVPLFFRHAKNVVPDMVLNFFIVGAMYSFIRYWQSSFKELDGHEQAKGGAGRFRLLFFVCCALGFMTKGFIAFIVPIATVIVLSIVYRNKKILSDLKFGQGLIVSLVIICPWFIYMIATHGQSYLDYMLVDETKNRLISSGSHNVLLKVVSTFLDHCLFYMTYFAPWSLFLLGAIPLALIKVKRNLTREIGLSLMLIWFFVVFCFFSLIYFSINHYMLVLSTPFALLVGFFFTEEFDCGRTGKIIISIARKVFPVMIFTVSMLAFCFLFVFLAGAAKWWLIIFFGVYVLSILIIFRSSNSTAAPLCLGILIAVVLSQTSLFDRAGVTSHSILQKFAITIQANVAGHPAAKVRIGVGSHDIHEKEFQVYFDEKIIKAASSDDADSDLRLSKLFSQNDRVLCLIIERDFDRFRNNAPPPGTYERIQEEYIFRRRMYIDQGFFKALLTLDQKTVNHYLKEKIILIEKT